MLANDKYRKLFPHTDHTIYLNHASCSPLSTKVTEELTEYIQWRSSGGIDVYPTYTKKIEEIRSLTGNLFNCSAKDISFHTNTSEGLNLIANGIKWKRGDRIILYEEDFPAITQSFLHLKKEGVIVDFIKPRDGKPSVDDIMRAIRPTTHMICISHVQFLNGFMVDLEFLGKLCHDRGIIFVVDAIQSAGYIPIDVKKMKIDALVTGGQKWLMGPLGTAVCYISEELRSMLQQTYVGWLSVENPWNFFDFEQGLKPSSSRFEIGTLNYMGIVGLGASIRLLMEIGIHHIERHISDLNKYIVHSLHTYGFRPALDYSQEGFSGIVSFIVNEPDILQQKLKQKNVVVSARSRFIRISPHFYNTTKEIDQFILILKDVEYQLKFNKSKELFGYPFQKKEIL